MDDLDQSFEDNFLHEKVTILTETVDFLLLHGVLLVEFVFVDYLESLNIRFSEELHLFIDELLVADLLLQLFESFYIMAQHISPVLGTEVGELLRVLNVGL